MRNAVNAAVLLLAVLAGTAVAGTECENYYLACINSCNIADADCVMDCTNRYTEWLNYCTQYSDCNRCAQAPAHRCVWEGGCVPCCRPTCVSNCGYVPFTPTPAPTVTPGTTPTPSPTPAPQSVCDRHQISCQNCTYYEGCGWSESLGKCLSGSATGAQDGSSSGTDWKWYPRDCSGTAPTPAPTATAYPTPGNEGCAGHSRGCGECTGYAGCGWSSSQRTCLYGDERGSSDGTSYGVDWVWLPSDCAGNAECPLLFPLLVLAGCALFISARRVN